MTFKPFLVLQLVFILGLWQPANPVSTLPFPTQLLPPPPQTRRTAENAISKGSRVCSGFNSSSDLTAKVTLQTFNSELKMVLKLIAVYRTITEVSRVKKEL